MNARTLILNWQPPLEENRNGPIVGYTANLTEILTGRNWQLLTETTQLIVNELHPFYSYNYSVAAKTSAGLGPFTAIMSVKMPEDGG